MEKAYTVYEGVGAVNVCVNLTQPVSDIILEETVIVFVIDYSSSIYVPSGAQLASELLILRTGSGPTCSVQHEHFGGNGSLTHRYFCLSHIARTLCSVYLSGQRPKCKVSKKCNNHLCR